VPLDAAYKAGHARPHAGQANNGTKLIGGYNGNSKESSTEESSSGKEGRPCKESLMLHS